MNFRLKLVQSPRVTRTTGFSLIELLVVLALVGVMAGLGAPALLSSAKSAKITQAGNTLADIAALARQTSSSGNAMVAMVLVKADLGRTDNRGAVGLFEFGSDRTWKQAGTWIRLPEGISVDVQSPPDSNKKISNAPIVLAGSSLSESDYDALIFFSDGRMHSEVNAAAPRVKVVASEPENSQNSYDIVFNVENSAFHISRP